MCPHVTISPTSLPMHPVGAPHFVCNVACKWGCKEGEEACKHSLHASPPSCHVCTPPHEWGCPVLSPSACGVCATPPLCKQGM